VIGVDTNVLVRYITQDDPKQSEAATRILEACSSESPGFINHIVLCELTWVLRRCYQTSRQDIARILDQILKTGQFKIQDPQAVWQALRSFQAGKADFADYLVGSINRNAGCEHTVTFDQEAGLSENFMLLD
jgi:predicted nucleic-acid-binding protein